METIFLLLSGVILLAGVLYWFWSHIQLTQKKVHLLENAVFELRTMLSTRGSPGPPAAEVVAATVGESRPYRDLDDDDWTEAAAEAADSTLIVTTTEVKENRTLEVIMEEYERADDVSLEKVDPALMPGGRIEVPSSADLVETEGEDQFKNLFVPPAAPASPPAADALDGMPVKELRRLAEQRGIVGAEGMRKKEILTALKAQIQPALTVPEPAVAVEKVEEEELSAVE